MRVKFDIHTRKASVTGPAFLKTTAHETVTVELFDNSEALPLEAGDTLTFTLKPAGERDRDPLTLNQAAEYDETEEVSTIAVDAWTDEVEELMGLGDADTSTDQTEWPCEAALVFTPDGEDPIESDTFKVTLKASVPLDADGTPASVTGTQITNTYLSVVCPDGTTRYVALSASPP